jgi:DNA repair protein RecO (recombination protein O)
MRHKYLAEAIVLARHPHGEANALITLLTSDFGIIRARAQGLRNPGSKMSPGLQTLMQSDVSLVRGKEGWRLVGAVLVRAWALELSPAARNRAGRVFDLMQRLVHGEDAEPRLYAIAWSLLEALTHLEEESADAAEMLAALRVLHALGLDAGQMPGTAEEYASEALDEITRARKGYISRINTGIAASGL